MWNKLKHHKRQLLELYWSPFWQHRQPRERLALKLLLATLILALIYFVGIKPILEQHQQAAQQLQNRMQDWAWLVKQADQVQQLRLENKVQQPLKLSTQSEALAHLQKAVRQYRLSAFLQQMRPIQNPIQGVAVHLRKAPADRVFQLLDHFEQLGWVAHKIEIQRINQSKQASEKTLEGWVHAQLFFALENAK